MFVCVCVFSHGDDVDEVVLSQRIQDGVDGVFGDGHLQSLHAAADVHHDDDVFGRRGCLDVPEHITTLTDQNSYDDITFIDYPLFIAFIKKERNSKPPTISMIIKIDK